MKKRIISLLLAVIMIVGMLPFSAITAFAEETVPTLTKKTDKFTVTVEGENYTEFYIEDFTTHQSDYLDSGDSYEVTAGGEYRIYATYEEPYVAENLGGWAVDPDSGKLFIDLTAGEAGESTTVTAPELKFVKKIKMTFHGAENYSTVEVTATDANGTRIVPKYDPTGFHYYVKPGDTVHISADFNVLQYYLDDRLTQGWEIKDNYVEYSFAVEDVSESLSIIFPELRNLDTYTVTVVGENYSVFHFCAQVHKLGTTFILPADQGYEITLEYDATLYKIENLGDWTEEKSGEISFVHEQKCAPGSEITVTAPTLTKKTYTVTVEGENYADFCVEDLVKDERCYLSPGESYEVIAGGKYKVYAYYDDSAYELKDPGDWKIDTESGDLYIELTAGEEGASTTVTAPTLISIKYTVNVKGENYSHFLAEDLTEEDYSYFNPGKACKLTPNHDYKIYAYYDDSAYEPKDLGAWATGTESGELYIELTAGGADESTTITAPTLTPITHTVIVTGENYFRIEVKESTGGNGHDISLNEPCKVKPNGKIGIYAYYDSSFYRIANFGDWCNISDHIYIELTAGEAGASTTVTAPELIKKIKMSFNGADNYSTVEVTATDSYGTHVIPKNDLDSMYHVCLGDTVNISADFNVDYYYLSGATAEGWKINGNHVEYSFVAEDVSEGLRINLPQLMAYDTYKVTIVGENYSVFYFGGAKYQLGTTLILPVSKGFTITAIYNTSAYRYEELGDWVDKDGELYYVSVGTGTVTEKDITITAPTLISIKYTVNVKGENYSHFLAEDLTEEDYLYFDPGEACKLTPNHDYKIYAYYDDSAYEPKDLGDWAIGTESGELYIELTAGGEDESTTITAPELTEKTEPYKLTVTGEKYSKLEIKDDNGTHEYNFGEPIELPTISGVQVIVTFDPKKFNAAETDGWDIENGVASCYFITGDVGGSKTIAAPTLIAKKVKLTLSGTEKYDEISISSDKEDIFSDIDGKYSITSGKEVVIVAHFNSEEYKVETLPDGWIQGDGTVSYTADNIKNDVTLTLPTLVPAFTVEFDGISLTLSSDISINFYMELPDDARQNGTMTFNIGGRIVTGIKARENENGYYFQAPLTALEMAETVTATFTYNGIDYVQEYSVQQYIDAILNGKDKDGKPYSDEMKLLARKIANYGYYAQVYLASIHSNVTIGKDGYEEMDKFDDVDIDVEKAIEALANYSVTVSGTSDNLSLYGSTVYFDSATALNYYVTVKNGVKPTAKAVNTVTGEEKQVEIKLYKGNIYIVSVKDIIATELADDITVTINDEITLTGSVFAYCNSVVKAHSFDGATEKDNFAVNAMAAFYEYYKAAVDYAERAVEYTVSFDMMGHGEQVSSQKVKKGGYATRPVPQAEGYYFDAWFKDETLQDQWIFDTDTVNGDITLYADWRKIITVTFDMMGHGTQLGQLNAYEGSTFGAPIEPMDSSFKFEGWYKDRNFTEKWNFDTDIVGNTDITLYAKWVAKQ